MPSSVFAFPQVSERSNGDYDDMATYGMNPSSKIVDPHDAARTSRMSELEAQALEARSRRQFEKLEEKVEKRQYLEARLLEAERMFRDEKLARKEAEENYNEATRRLNDATNSRLKVEEQASTLARTEDEVRKMDAIVSKLKDRVPVLTTELEKTLAVAHEQSLELSSFDAESNQQSRVIQQERLEAQNAMEEELRELGLQVARLSEHVENSGKVTHRDSEVLKGLIYDETKMLLSAQGDVEQRKLDMKSIDARLNRILKTLELTQEAHYHLKANMDNTSTLLKEAKENDEREYKFMHRRLTMPYMREELKYDENAKRTDPLPHQRPNRSVLPVRFENHKPMAKFEMEDESEGEVEARRAESDAQINGSLDFAFNFVQKPDDPLDGQPPLPPAPPGALADLLHTDPTEGEALVSQSIQLLKEMQLKQASTNNNLTKQAEVYNMSLDRLDREIKMHQKHLDEIDEEDFSQWNKQQPNSPDRVGKTGKPRKGSAKATAVAGKSVMDLFTHYDQDNSGDINKGELICLLADIGVLDGLAPQESSAIIDREFAEADVNNDGGIGYNEFVKFMDKFSHLKRKPALPQNIPDSFRKNGKDEIVWHIYLQHCSKKYPQEMGSAQFIRAMRKAGFVDVKINPSTTAILFAKARKPLAKRMQYPEFLRALAYMATARELTFEQAAAQFTNKAILRPVRGVSVPKSSTFVPAERSAPRAVASVAEVPVAEDTIEEEPAQQEEGEEAVEGEDVAAEGKDAVEGEEAAAEAEEEAVEEPAAEAEYDEEPAEGNDGLEVDDDEDDDAPAPAPVMTNQDSHLSEKAQDTKSALMAKAGTKHNMKSWELKDKIDAIGQTPVPKSMVEASGNKLNIREFFKQCCSGGRKELLLEECQRLLLSLEVFKGLEDAEVEDITSEYFRAMDTNGDGVVSFDEFAIFYMDVKETKKGGAPKAKAKVNPKYKKDSGLKNLFIQHASYGKGKNHAAEEMDGAAFAKLVAAAGLLDSKLTNITVDLVFTKSKFKGKRRLTYSNFLDALAQIASHKGFEYDQLVSIVMESGPPKRSEMPTGKMHLRKTSYPGMPTDTGPKRVGRLSAEGAPKLGQARVKKVMEGVEIQPIPMKSKVGKNLTIREMFDLFDPNQDGVLDRVEFGKIVVELQLTRNMTNSEASETIDKHYSDCDIKGEGNIDYREFSNWYKTLTGERRTSDAASSAPKVPLEYRRNTEFKALYTQHASFGKGNKKVDTLDSAGFVKCLRQAGLLRGKLNVTTADLIFTKSKEKGQRMIKYVAFLEALAQCAATLGVTFQEVADTVIESGPPKR
ncbi:EF-hand domain-containing protein [bacterium]|nr:EF-hand domain-containing protein [bacterium]